VFFDLITIRFLLRYLSRPLHFFGTCGHGQHLERVRHRGMLVERKLFHHSDLLVQHGPLMIFAAVAVLAGLNMLAVGLLVEMQVRHYHEPSRRAPYSVDRVPAIAERRAHRAGVKSSTPDVIRGGACHPARYQRNHGSAGRC